MMCDPGVFNLVGPSENSNWNVLTNHWLELISLDATPCVRSPTDALEQAREYRAIVAASSLDLFAAHRFLLTLLYWKADSAGGVQEVRQALLDGKMPSKVLEAIRAEAHCFHLFDAKTPFLQDASACDLKTKSAGSLFADFSCGTNIAHFHHGDDDNMRLCLRCATVGMLRLVPWTQSGGAGLSPAIHNAPPIMALAQGENLAVTLGLNLVPVPGGVGLAKWSGHFKASKPRDPIPLLEALTWNPRRVHLGRPQEDGTCWRCGRRDGVVGPIVYAKNPETAAIKDGNKNIPFQWQDPAAFYAADEPFTTAKSYDEESAAAGGDIRRLLGRGEMIPSSSIVKENAGHRSWWLVIPCTNPANNKTYDHRQLALPSLSAEFLRVLVPAAAPGGRPPGLDGWREPSGGAFPAGAARFVSAAARLLTPADWAALSAAAYREMHESPAAFDILSGLLWSLRGRNVAGLPSRNIAWLMLKLMAAVPARARIPDARARFCPLRSIPKRQVDERRGERAALSPYPISLPRGHRLEADLRSVLDRHLRQRMPAAIDWAGLCQRLDELFD